MEAYTSDNCMFTTWREYTEELWSDPGTVRESDPQDRYDSMMASFAAMVRGEKENPYTLDYELALYKLVLQCCGL